MKSINKIGLLVLSDDKKKFLVVVKNHMTSAFLLPGGKVEKGESDEECLAREVKEELDCELDSASLKFIGEYEDVASGYSGRQVRIRLYQGDMKDEPKASGEIIELHWIGKEDLNNVRLSPIIKNQIIPDLVRRKILH